ncbi:hypothetical protein TNCT_724541 [Trichonephila clavata]|uniref:Uncharacterized protein n=1 Tax=Trichonephila clavata TaxID=2740835 RepID=A0A8X6G9B5_TRICU|nr:hypothetical protein TNCT_724541 [Trichonephila clavata]
MVSSPASEVRVPLFAPSVTNFPVRGLFQAVEPSIHVTPLLQPPARDNVPSLIKLCISFIYRGLALAASQSPPASPSPDLPATPFGKNVVGAIPVVVDAPLVPARPAPAPPVLHPLASGVSGNTPPLSACSKCHFCDHFSKTQKGLNHHLVRVHRYSVAPREKRVAFSSPPVSSQSESLTATPSGFPDSALEPAFPVVAPAPLPSADATFIISSVMLSPFHQEWIKWCSEATPDSIDELVRYLADWVLKRPSSSCHARGQRDRSRLSQQPSTPAVETTTPHSNISRLRYDPAEALKIQRAYRVCCWLPLVTLFCYAVVRTFSAARLSPSSVHPPLGFLSVSARLLFSRDPHAFLIHKFSGSFVILNSSRLLLDFSFAAEYIAYLGHS